MFDAIDYWYDRSKHYLILISFWLFAFFVAALLVTLLEPSEVKANPVGDMRILIQLEQQQLEVLKDIRQILKTRRQSK